MHLGFKEELKELLGEGTMVKEDYQKCLLKRNTLVELRNFRNFMMARSLRNCLIVVKGLTTFKEVMMDVRLAVI